MSAGLGFAYTRGGTNHTFSRALTSNIGPRTIESRYWEVFARKMGTVMGKSVATVRYGSMEDTGFFEAAEEHLVNSEFAAVRRLYDFAISEGYEIKWGTGKQTGSFSVSALKMFQKSFISVFTDGRMWLNFGLFQGSDSIEEFRSDFAKGAEKIFGISLPSDLDSKFPSLDIKDWSPKLEEFINLLHELVSHYSGNDT